MIKIKRVYEPRHPDDGSRFLVERLWPRGIKKEDLQMEAWLKGVAPSDGLRRWFGHDPAKWREFQRRYFAELKMRDASTLIDAAARRGNVTLLYSSRDEEHNNALALKAYLEKQREVPQRSKRKAERMKSHRDLG